MGIYTEAIQKLYVAYFSRPADSAGLAYWEGVVAAAKGNTAAVSAAFAASAEYKAAYGNLDAYHVVDAVYMNLFGRHAEPAGLEYWGQALIKGIVTIDAVVTAVAAGAQTTDLEAYQNKVAAATAFTAALDTTEEILGYSGDTANAAAQAWIASVTTDASLAAAIDPTALAATVLSVTTEIPTPITAQLTIGLDTFTGGAGNDVINATTTGGVLALTTFDEINAGAGTDTMRFVDTQTLATAQFKVGAGATVTGVEVIDVATTGGIDLSTKVWAGVTDLNVTAAGTAAVKLTAADTTSVNVASAAAANTTTINGGSSVTVSLSDATAGDVTITGAGLTDVAVVGGAIVTVDNTKADGTSAGGTTLTSVSLDGVTGATAALKGKSLTDVTLRNIAVNNTVTITNSTAGHALNLTVDAAGSVAGATTTTVVDAAATSVSIAAEGTKSNVALTAVEAASLTLSGSVDLALDVNGGTNTKLKTIDGAAATGKITLTDTASTITTITTGAGADTFTLNTATLKDDAATTTVNETVSATATTNAGNDVVTVATTGTGLTTVNTGAGNDTVNITARSSTLVVDLGDGDDTFTATAAINGTDTINAGAGTDILTLSLVGAANIGAFAGFDVFDAAGLNRTLDVDILATKNTVSEFIATGSVGTAALTNVGAGVGFRATATMADALALTQKTAGAITVTVDADETGTADTAIDTATAGVNVTNATSVKAVFATDYLAKITGETTAGDNVTTFNVTAGAATSAEIVSGGTGSVNVLNYTDAVGGKLTSATVTGSQALTIDFVNSAKLATVDATAHTGGLTMSTADLADGGTIKLGSGTDVITVTNTSTTGGIESISGIEKTAAVAISVKAEDATAAAAAVAAADVLVLASAQVASDFTDANGVLDNGVLTFSGTGPATLEAAIALAGAAAETDGEALVFEYLGNSYVFVQGVTDTVVKLTGVTGLTNMVETGTDKFFFI